MIEVAVHQVRVGYDQHLEAIHLLYSLPIHGPTQQTERKRLARVTAALTEALAPLFGLQLSLPMCWVTDRGENFHAISGINQDGGTKRQYQHWHGYQPTNPPLHHTHHTHHHLSTKKNVVYDSKDGMEGNVSMHCTAGGAFRAVGRFAAGLFLCYSGSSWEEAEEEHDQKRKKTVMSEEDKGLKSAEMCGRMDGFAVEKRSMTWYAEYSKVGVDDVWTERRRNVMLDLNEMARGLAQVCLFIIGAFILILVWFGFFLGVLSKNKSSLQKGNRLI